MKQPGIYYNSETNTIILGYLKPGKYRDRIVGRVIGHTGKAREEWFFRAYNTGYEYNDWSATYIGRYTTFTTLKGYLDFLKDASTEQIEYYFACKKSIEEYMGSYVVFRKKDGHAWYERRYKHLN